MNPPPPPRGPGLASLAVVVALVLAALAAGVALAAPLRTAAEGAWQRLSEANAGPDAGVAADGQVTWYISQMHPWIIQPEPGTCPICGMDLTPVDPERFLGALEVDPRVVANIGVRIAPVVAGPLEREIRTPATLEWAETGLVDITLKTPGWAERVAVRETGALVAAGDELFAYYSPEVYQAQDDYLQALRERRRPGGEALLSAARTRLRLLDVPDDLIEDIEREQAPRRLVPVRAPKSGVVIERMAVAGMYLAAGMRAYRLADPDELWAQAAIYEHQLPLVGEGLEVQLDLATGDTLTGTLEHLEPWLDPDRRQARARLVFANPGRRLKPGMYGTARLIVRQREEAVLAPTEAVVRTGERAVAFVSLGDGRFLPREVTLGPETGDGRVAIESGLAAGEQVVVSGQFLLDSESRIKEALAKTILGTQAADQEPILAGTGADSGAGSAPGKPATAISEQETPFVSLTPAADKALVSLLDAYFHVQDALYRGQALAPGAERLKAAADAFAAAGGPQGGELAAAAERLTAATDAASARPVFGQLGVILDPLVKSVGVPPEFSQTVAGVACGMFEAAPEGGVWLQLGTATRNPFYGAGHGMAGCFADKWAIPKRPAAAGQGAGGGERQSDPTATGPTTGTATDRVDAGLLTAYLGAGTALYEDDLGAAQEALRPYAGREQVDALLAADALQAARGAFGALGIALDEHLKAHGMPAGFGTELVGKRCGMYRHAPDKGIWIQAAGDTKNPFFGVNRGMRACAVDEWSYGPEAPAQEAGGE